MNKLIIFNLNDLKTEVFGKQDKEKLEKEKNFLMQLQYRKKKTLKERQDKEIFIIQFQIQELPHQKQCKQPLKLFLKKELSIGELLINMKLPNLVVK